MGNSKFIYKCTNCCKEYSSEDVLYLCPTCSAENTPSQPAKGVLKIFYDYQTIRNTIKRFNDIKRKRYLPLLPIKKISSFPTLRIGNTPIYEIHKLDGVQLPFKLFIKDDSQNPTFSFKDRASALVSAFAKENKLDTIVAASTGNAGSSLAGICANQGQNAVILVPESAPLAKLTQIVMAGANIIPVKGTYDEAFDLSLLATKEFGWYNRNTAFNPLTVEGKKTVSYEVFDQMKNRIPDRIFVPVGDGVILSGVYKGFEDLLLLNILDRIPKIVAIQSALSDNLVRNVGKVDFEVKPSHTIADSISVDIPRNFYMAQKFIQKYEGEMLTVTDDEIISASKILTKSTGLFSEPAGATAMAGLISYQKSGKIAPKSINLVLLTGSGLKDLNSLKSIVNVPDSIYPTIDNLKKILR